jgi:hypothetical protein
MIERTIGRFHHRADLALVAKVVAFKRQFVAEEITLVRREGQDG